MNHSYWLEIAETITLFLVGLGAIITLVTSNLLFVVIPMVATLALNKINRREKEKQIYHKTLAKLEHLQNQVWSELQSLQKLIEVLQEHDDNPPPPTLQGKAYLTSESSLNGHQDYELKEKYEEYLVSLEESLNHVIQYLNQLGINQRFQQLEEFCDNINSEIIHLSRKLNYTYQLTQKDSDSTPLLLFGKDPVASNLEIQGPQVDPKEETATEIESETTDRLEAKSQISEGKEDREINTKNLEISLPLQKYLAQKWVKLHSFLAHENGITDLVISEDNYLVISVSLDQNLKIWALETGQLLYSTLAHDKGILAVDCGRKVSINKENTTYLIASGGFDYNIKLWEFITNQKDLFNLTNKQILSGHLGSIRALKFDPDREILISGGYDKILKQWSTEDGKLIQNSFDNLSSIQSIIVSYDGQIMATGGEDGKIDFWSVKTGLKRGSLQGNQETVKCLDLSSNGQFLGAGCSDGTVKIWALEPRIFQEGFEPEPAMIFNHHSGEIKALLFSPCGNYLISGDTMGKVLVCSLNTGEIEETLILNQDHPEENPQLLSLIFSGDSNFFVTGDIRGYITIWGKK